MLIKIIFKKFWIQQHINKLIIKMIIKMSIINFKNEEFVFKSKESIWKETDQRKK